LYDKPIDPDLINKLLLPLKKLRDCREPHIGLGKYDPKIDEYS